MVKVVFFCTRRPDISRDAYVDRLLGRHVSLALKHHQTMRRYIVNIVEEAPAGEPEIDSVGELYFDSLADYRDRLYDSAAGKAAIEADVASFLGGAAAYATTEHVQKAFAVPAAVGTRVPGVKMICPVRRRPDMTHAAFVEHWLGRHVPLALQHHPGLSRYVTNVVDERLSASGPDWDGIAELSFGSADDVRRGLFDSPEGERIIRADIARFIGHTCAYRVGEYVQRVGP